MAFVSFISNKNKQRFNIDTIVFRGWPSGSEVIKCQTTPSVSNIFAVAWDTTMAKDTLNYVHTWHYSPSDSIVNINNSTKGEEEEEDDDDDEVFQ